jgi:hypothetical protein
VNDYALFRLIGNNIPLSELFLEGLKKKYYVSFPEKRGHAVPFIFDLNECIHDNIEFLYSLPENKGYCCNQSIQPC